MASPEPSSAELVREAEPSDDEEWASTSDESSPGDCSDIWSCDCCVDLLRDSDPYYNHTEIHEAAQKGCNRCWIIARAVQAMVEQYKLDKIKDWSENVRISAWGQRLHGWFHATLYFLADIFVEQSSAITDKFKWRNSESLRVMRDITVEGVPGVCLHFASETLQNCVQNHERCRGNSSLGYIPRRLVDVGTDSIVKVIDNARSSVLPGSKYAALTYCWGPPSAIKDNMLKMTAQNLKEMAKGIPLDGLPRVFQDAIKTTRSLQIQYLWIDALCIAQGDGEEWRTESLVMRQVYAGAHVTISADAAATCNDSFLEMPHRQWRQAIDIGTRRFGSRILTKLANDMYHSYGQFNSCPSPKEAEYKLHSRGWTLQEALLSPRLIYFGFDQVYFSCAEEGLSAEEGNKDLSNNVSKLDELRQEWLQLESRQQNNSTHPNSELFDLWDSLIHDYTGRDLSEPDDLLPAISGLASQLQQLLNPHSRYCAGVWEAQFLRGLFWVRWGRPRNPPTKSPSWSWVSCSGQVGHEQGATPGETLAELVTLEPSPKDQQFGHIDYMEATIEGPMLDVVLRINQDGETYITSLGPGGHPSPSQLWSWSMDNWTESDQKSPSTLLRPIREGFPDIWNQRGGSAHLLALGTSGSWVRHLVLLRSTTMSNTYLRIGFCRWWSDLGRAVWERLRKSWMAKFERKRIVIV